MTGKLRGEIVLVVGAIVAAVNAIQLAALHLPSWANTAVAVVSIAGGAVLTRMQVTPVAPAGGDGT